MTLASRVSLFFLASLAVTLVGFSTMLYVLADRHLIHQLDRQVESALTALTAAVEIKEDGVEWELHERRLELPGVRWLARDPEGRIVGASPEEFPELTASVQVNGPDPVRMVSEDGHTWQVHASRVAPDRLPIPRSATERPDPNKHESLTLIAAAPAGPMDATLRLLGWTLATLSLAVWSAAALLGGWLCRRTLAPVSRMAESARSIPAGEPGRRLEVAATRDELEDLGRSFNGLLDRLQEVLERQRRFTGDASHQLRTPLAVMLGQVEVALRRERPAQEYQRVLGIVQDQADRLHRIVEMLLFLARADAESALPGVSPLALKPWLEDHLKTWATHPRAADIHLLHPDDTVYALAHPRLLEQVVDILLVNAFEYSPTGSPVSLSMCADAAHVLVKVDDAGCGISREDLPHIFEPFFRSPQQKGNGTSGVGLGLAIARRVIEAMGGRIAVESVSGLGSQFTIRLSQPSPARLEDEGAVDAK